MRKRIVGTQRGTQIWDSDPNRWLDLDQIATVEVTSEDAAFPIESALLLHNGPGWRASEKGDQLIRIIFDEPLPIRCMQLHFEEPAITRTQEFTVRWSSANGGAPTEIVRQQWIFSPAGSTAETEYYVVDLERVSSLEIAINPDVSGGEALASLSSWRLG
jgi:hypothetical protein